MKIGIVGLGLIGGSLCRAIKLYTDHRVYGGTRNQATIAFAKSVGAIDEAIEDLSELDICIPALPPEATMDFLVSNVGNFKKGAIVMDICGVKEPICQVADKLYHDAGIRFVGGHPMAGKERAGFANSDADLYQGASFILTPTQYTDLEALEILTQLGYDIGCRRVIRATPNEHDRNIAYTSQLAHVVSSAYVKSPTVAHVLGFTAGSFQDMTRVAKLDVEMWSTLFLANKEPLLAEIDTLIQNLTQFRQELSAENREEMANLLQKGKDLREEVLRKQHQSA
ncbi:MAG: prephenate dehydrogenase/arogenate dehydrogenase family protein [Eubacteriales bacterium]